MLAASNQRAEPERRHVVPATTSYHHRHNVDNSRLAPVGRKAKGVSASSTAFLCIIVGLCASTILWGPTNLKTLKESYHAHGSAYSSMIYEVSDSGTNTQGQSQQQQNEYGNETNELLVSISSPSSSDQRVNPRNKMIDARNGTAACLLTKDDLPVLPEWITYHYHTFNVRHLIVAVDPTSQTSPSKLLNTFRAALPGLQILEWTDADYMPEYFLRQQQNNTAQQKIDASNGTTKHQEQIPNFVPGMFKRANTSRWHLGNETDEQVQRDAEAVNIHRFRQRTFLHKCHAHIHGLLKKEQHQPNMWVLNVDSDEFVVVNPTIRSGPNRVSKIRVPSSASAGSTYQFLEDMFAEYPKRIKRACISMPTLLFGSVENATSNSTPGASVSLRNLTSFETVRWRWHAPYVDTNNGFFKTIMDVSAVPSTDPVLAGPYALSPHQPSPTLCAKFIIKPEISAGRKFPLTINHYLGSFEKYSARKDGRRSIRVYQRRANMTGGYEDGWTPSWVSSFVESVGLDTARSILTAHMKE